jgi:hypothetical protein
VDFSTMTKDENVLIPSEILRVLESEPLRDIYSPGFLDDERLEGVMCFVPMHETLYLKFQSGFLKLENISTMNMMTLDFVTGIETHNEFEVVDSDFYIGSMLRLNLVYDGEHWIDEMTLFFDKDNLDEQDIAVHGMELVLRRGEYIFLDPYGLTGIMIQQCREQRDQRLEWLSRVTEIHSSSWKRG